MNFFKKTKITSDLKESFLFTHLGYCVCCDKNVEFKATNSFLRESYLCTNCASVPRERALMFVIEEYYPQWRKLKIHESSPVARGASVKLSKFCKKYTPTQYFPDKKHGEFLNGFRNEDLEHQTFLDNSFDLVITQDVFEHIYNPELAFKEIERTLKKGGAHIFTVPIINKHKQTQIWAVANKDGSPRFLHKPIPGEPDYHGNPVDPKGSPVTMHWGFDIINFIKKCNTNMDTEIISTYDQRRGIMGEYREVFLSKKK